MPDLVFTKIVPKEKSPAKRLTFGRTFTPCFYFIFSSFAVLVFFSALLPVASLPAISPGIFPAF